LNPGFSNLTPSFCSHSPEGGSFFLKLVNNLWLLSFLGFPLLVFQHLCKQFLVLNILFEKKNKEEALQLVYVRVRLADPKLLPPKPIFSQNTGL
jgi:hypothetical protein